MRIRWIPRIPKKKPSTTYKFLIFPLLKRLLFLKQIFFILFKKFDVVYVQRYFVNAYLLQILKKSKAVIIFDFDDAIYLDQPGKNVNQKKTGIMLKYASQIIVSAAELETYCRSQGYSNVTVITTPIDIERFHRVPKPEMPVVIGWIGSSYTSRFLKMLEETLIELNRTFDFKLLVIGAGKDFTISNIEMEVVPWEYEQEPDMIGSMDIGIMPLPNEDYAKGKGGYKIFQYMASALPVVASPIGINSEIVNHGRNGFLAETKEEWFRYLSLLINDRQLRKELGNAGRSDAEKYYSRNVCFKKLAAVINSELHHNVK